MHKWCCALTSVRSTADDSRVSLTSGEGSTLMKAHDRELHRCGKILIPASQLKLEGVSVINDHAIPGR